MNTNNRYSRVKFHDDPDTNKRIQALMTYYDLEIINYKLPYKKQIKLIVSHIHDFVRFQEYEAAAVFTKRKMDMYKRYRKENRKFTFKFMLRILKFKISQWWRKHIVMEIHPDSDF